MLKIGYQGIEGSNAWDMALYWGGKFEDDVEYMPLINSYGVIEALNNKQIDFGVIAVKNNLGGVVKESKKALKHSNYEIIDKSDKQIHHCIYMINLKINNDIKAIVSHQQVLKQCKNNIKKYFNNITRLEYEDTALAARDLYEGIIDKNSAVICSKQAGEMYNLKLLIENIEDAPSITQFILIKTNI